VVGIVVVGLVVWSLFDSAISTAVRAVIALAGYLVVGFVAYSVGKWVGRRRALRSP
jgi:ABC-type polysaccharide/polyol phosphate export permease